MAVKYRWFAAALFSLFAFPVVDAVLADDGKTADFEPTADELEMVEFYNQPKEWFAENLREAPIMLDGQHLHPKLQYFLEQVNGSWMPRFVQEWLFSMSWGRDYIRNAVDRHWLLMSKETKPMRQVEDRMIEGRAGKIPVRIYYPQSDEDAPLPMIVYSHGGGWVFASVKAVDRSSRLLANEAGVIVISVDYRRAPEHPYPAASDDGEDVFLWARDNAASLGGDPALVAVGGDSAGGHVSINISQRQLARGEEPPAYQLLYYPGTSLDRNSRSFELFGEGFLLDSHFIDFILPRVFPGLKEDEADGFMEPLKAESLNGMPPSIVATAGFDILRDSGKAFAERLEAEGVSTRYFHYPSLIHGFLQHTGFVDDAETASVETAQIFGKDIRQLRTD